MHGLQIWQEDSHGLSEQKPVKIFGEQGAWAYPGTAQMFWAVPQLSTNFKFGSYIQREHPNKKTITIKKFWQKGSVDVSAYPGTAQIFFGYPLLSLERVKLRISNFVRIFIASIGKKAR